MATVALLVESGKGNHVLTWISRASFSPFILTLGPGKSWRIAGEHPVRLDALRIFRINVSCSLKLLCEKINPEYIHTGIYESDQYVDRRGCGSDG